MKKEKMKLDTLKIQSFVTQFNSIEKKTVEGAAAGKDGLEIGQDTGPISNGKNGFCPTEVHPGTCKSGQKYTCDFWCWLGTKLYGCGNNTQG